MTFPVKDGRITQDFSKSHPGIDIAPPKAGQTGVACVAPETAVVSVSSFRTSPEGNYIILKGASGRYYYFGHFATRSVRTGQLVSEGQKIGELGMTGAATGIHTHFEVRPTISAENQINPTTIFKEEEVDRILTTHEARMIYADYGIEVAGSDPALKNRRELELRQGIAGQVKNTLNVLNKRIADLEQSGGGQFKPYPGQLFIKEV